MVVPVLQEPSPSAAESARDTSAKTDRMAASNGVEGDRFNTPSPQPIHLSVGWKHNQHVLKDDASGYVAPAFEGKEEQMKSGRCSEQASDGALRSS